MAKTKSAKRFANFWTHKNERKRWSSDPKSQGVFFSLAIFLGLGLGRWRVPEFLEPHPFPRCSSITWASFPPDRNGWPSWTKNFKTFRPPSVWGARWVWLIWNDPKTCEERQKDGDIIMGYLYIYSCCFKKIRKHSPQFTTAAKKLFFPRTEVKYGTILFNITVSATLQKKSRIHHQSPCLAGQHPCTLHPGEIFVDINPLVFKASNNRFQSGCFF